ncbi:MAG: hypothetical protein O7B24_15810 [Alphaproteobacteria bacterium]|nr:hypothetical protein [Alphaproteobacteria bacterium]
MAISPTGPVSTLVSDASQPRPATAPLPAQQTTQADIPSQAVTPPSTDTGVEQQASRDRQVDVIV